MDKNITEKEIPRLPENFNLTDGHAYRTWSSNEEEIINKASEFLKTATRQQQSKLEEDYVHTFLALAEQTIDFNSNKYLQCTSASLALEIVANYLRLNKMSLTLVEPCFDNLADIFKRHGVMLTPFSDENFDRPSFVKQLKTVKADAICLVSPNNPTGNVLTKDNFIALVNFCKKYNKLLILDFCFRAYLPRELIYDQYNILIESGINYLVIEDTGKTWPTVELKAPFLVVSKHLYQPVYDIYTDLLLHVSPFIIKLMTEFINNSITDRLSSVHSVVEENRKVLYKSIQNTILTPVEKPYASIAWLKIKGRTGNEVEDMLNLHKVYILSGEYFYWSNHKKGEEYIRIALTRDTTIFKKAAAIIADICRV